MSDGRDNPAFKHGHNRRARRTTEYKIWASMKTRCLNERDPAFRYYGARGITVCDRWRDSFEAFLEDMGARPSAEHTLEREDNNGNYEPGNCKWATRVTQMRNTRRAILVTIGPETLPLKTWCERTGVPYKVAHQRIKKGWEQARAVTEPPTHSRPVHPVARRCAICSAVFTPHAKNRGSTKTCSKRCGGLLASAKRKARAA